MPITAITRGTTRVLSLTLEGVPDISGDTVTLTAKSDKSDADPGVLQTTADVAAYGAFGVAVFTLTPVQTNLAPGHYYMDVIWETAAGAVFPLNVGSDMLMIIERVSD